MRNWKYAIAAAAIGLAAFLLYRTLSRYSLDQLDCRRHGRARAEAPGRRRFRRCKLPVPDIFRLSGPALREAAAALPEGGPGFLHGLVPRPQYRIGCFEQWRSPIPFLQPLGLEDRRRRQGNRLLRHHRRARPPGPGRRGAPAAVRSGGGDHRAHAAGRDCLRHRLPCAARDLSDPLSHRAETFDDQALVSGNAAAPACDTDRS